MQDISFPEELQPEKDEEETEEQELDDQKETPPEAPKKTIKEQKKGPRMVDTDVGLTIVVLLVIIAFGLLWYFKYKGAFDASSLGFNRPEEAGNENVANENKEFGEKVDLKTDTTLWEVYSVIRTAGNFNFKIPKDWQARITLGSTNPLFEALLDPEYISYTNPAPQNANANLNSITTTPTTTSSFKIFTSTLIYENQLKKYENLKNSKPAGTAFKDESYTLGTKKGRKYTYRSRTSANYDIIDIVVPLNFTAKSLVVRLNNISENKKIFEAMLKTFEFK